MQYSITYGGSNQVLAISQYDVFPSTLAAGEYACTLAQFNNPAAWIPSGGTLVASPNAAALALSAAQAAQTTTLRQSYTTAISQPVSFTSAGGVAKTFQTDADSLTKLQQMITAYAAGTPTGFYWKAADNTKVPFTIADLKGLALAAGNQGWAAFQNLQTKIDSVYAPTTTTVAQVQAIVF